MVAVACPDPTAVQVRAAASSAPSAPNTSAASCWASARVWAWSAASAWSALVAVDGGLVVGSLALRGLLAGERRLGQAAQRVAVAGWVGLVHVSSDTDGERHGCSRTSLTVGAARLGYQRCKTARA